MPPTHTVDLDFVEQQVHTYLDTGLAEKKISQELYDKAKSNVVKNLKAWLSDENITRLSPNLTLGVADAVAEGRWADIAELYIDHVSFGTGGIRGRAVLRAYDEPNEKDELVRFAREGLDARVLKGPNSINSIVLLLKSAGVAKYAASKQFGSIVLGYDSRIRGRDFTELNAQLFLAYGLRVYMFDEAVPYPELMFAAVNLGADMGVFISASHNDKRYNGYKVCRYGAQFDAAERNDIYHNFIAKATTNDIKLKELAEASDRELIFLGGAALLSGGQYHGSSHGRTLIDMHSLHMQHSKQFVIDHELLATWASKIKIGYGAFHGSGRYIVPKLLGDLGFSDIKVVERMQDLNGLFPLYSVVQQPDPGDRETMEVAVREFISEHGQQAFNELDMFVGTDPDADRTGLIVRTPYQSPTLYGDKNYTLLDADEAWTALLWYRLFKGQQGGASNSEHQFVAYTHVTTDAIALLAKKYGLGYLRTWVGFAFLANAVLKVWRGENIAPEQNQGLIFETFDMNPRRTMNVLACEQSNGFSILGDVPKTPNSFGVGGHIKDKDGTMATLLLAELATYAKSVGKNIIQLLDEHVYLDPAIGLFFNYYEPSPKFGQYEGLEGISKKIAIMKGAEALVEQVVSGAAIMLGGLHVTKAEAYRTGKYDELHNWRGFPDEGLRFFFDDEYNHLTVRPSGTSQSLRVHVQLRTIDVSRGNIVQKKEEFKRLAQAMVAELRDRLDIHD